MPGCRQGPLETYKQRLERCVRKVKAKNRRGKAKKANPFAVCRLTVKKFTGKQRRRVRSGQPGYKALVRKGAPKCPVR